MFSCCEREDGTKYLHLCGCPSASYTCVSKSIEPELCGYEEFVGTIPAKKYLMLTNTVSMPGSEADGCDSMAGSTVREWEVAGVNGCDYLGITSDPIPVYKPNGDLRWYAHTTCPGCVYTSSTHGSNSYPGDCPSSYTATLSVEDKPEDAILRAEAEEYTGTACSSLWEERISSRIYTWIKRTSDYTIKCSGLIVGLKYKVTPVIQMRTARDGSGDDRGEWEDVTVPSKTFTASDDEKELPEAALGHIEGFEYKIIDVDIEPVYT